MFDPRTPELTADTNPIAWPDRLVAPLTLPIGPLRNVGYADDQRPHFAVSLDHPAPTPREIIQTIVLN